MKREKILTLILAGGEGGRLDALTEGRAKPALPFGGSLRLIDFSLSNCLHSQLADVWVIEQYELHSLNDHLANGRPWDLDRTYGGLQVLPPSSGRGDGKGKGDQDKGREGGFAKGNADAIYRHRKLIREFNPDLMVVLSADHVYKLDYREVIDRHRERGADVTMVTVKTPAGDEASRFGVVQVDETDGGRVTDFAYKPKQPRGDLVTAEVFVYRTAKLLETLDELVEEDGELKDYGDKLIPRLVKAGRAYAYRMESYWRDVGTLESYWQAHMDLLAQKSALALDDPKWPILTYGSQRLPAHIQGTAKIENSLISAGCAVAGHVIRCVLAEGVFIDAGAMVSDSVLLHGARLEKGAVVRRAIVDEGAVIGVGASVGGEELSVVGSRANIEAGTTIGGGARVPPKPADD
jgi:glucose-1-phosphate adenylyltransferase